MFDGITAVYRSNVDLIFYIVGDQEENELMLMSVLSTFYDSVAILLRSAINVNSRDLQGLPLPYARHFALFDPIGVRFVMQRLAYLSAHQPLLTCAGIKSRSDLFLTTWTLFSL